MRRREFLILVGGAAGLWPLTAQSDPVRRIGVLSGLAEDDPQMKSRLAGFRQGLERRGWSEGRNVRIDYRFAASGPDRYQPLAKELIALQPEVILAHSTPVATALQREKPQNSDRFRQCFRPNRFRPDCQLCTTGRQSYRRALLRGEHRRQVASDAQGDRTAAEARRFGS